METKVESPNSTIRKGEWKLIPTGIDGHEELYKLAEDPWRAVILLFIKITLMNIHLYVLHAGPWCYINSWYTMYRAQTALLYTYIFSIQCIETALTCVFDRLKRDIAPMFFRWLWRTLAPTKFGVGQGEADRPWSSGFISRVLSLLYIIILVLEFVKEREFDYTYYQSLSYRIVFPTIISW